MFAEEQEPILLCQVAGACARRVATSRVHNKNISVPKTGVNKLGQEELWGLLES